MRPDPRIQRPYGTQTVCPYLRASLRKDELRIAFDCDVTGDSATAIFDAIRRCAATFVAQCEANASHQALLLVFPRLRADSYHLLDDVQLEAKDLMVENGLMIGQFHPGCRTSAVHNPLWRGISVSPYPLVAMRNMVVHDILFLHEKKHWFMEYARRYGPALEEAKDRRPAYTFLWALYSKARDHFTSTHKTALVSAGMACPSPH
jgi:heptaprenyl diphosphate synthase